MTEVIIGENEQLEGALKRFNRKVQHDGILSEFRRHEYYEKPSVKRKRKRAMKRQKSLRSSYKALL